jgi:hypothetical protein
VDTVRIAAEGLAALVERRKQMACPKCQRPFVVCDDDLCAPRSRFYLACCRGVGIFHQNNCPQRGK